MPSPAQVVPVLISVVIPVFDQGAEVRNAVDSALRCAWVAEVIVVDDGSCDPVTAETVGNDRRIRLVRQANGGPSAARNRGVREATAPYLWFLDGDDELIAGATEGAETWTEDLIRFGCERVFADGQTQTRFATPADEAMPRGVPLAGSFVITNALFDEIGGYDERLRFAENTELLLRAQLRLANRGERPRFIRRATVRYRPSNEGRIRYSRGRAEAAVRMVELHGSHMTRQDLRDHWSIAAVAYGHVGDRLSAVRCAARAWRLDRSSPKAAARVLKLAVARPTA